jgi:hypothetical protein
MSTAGTTEQEREPEEHGPHTKSHLFLWLAVPRRDILADCAPDGIRISP